MTDADRQLRQAILDHPHEDIKGTAQLIGAYWHDADRADRTPRSYCYLDLGIMHGLLTRALSERPK